MTRGRGLSPAALPSRNLLNLCSLGLNVYWGGNGGRRLRHPGPREGICPGEARVWCRVWQRRLGPDILVGPLGHSRWVPRVPGEGRRPGLGCTGCVVQWLAHCWGRGTGQTLAGARRRWGGGAGRGWHQGRQGSQRAQGRILRWAILTNSHTQHTLTRAHSQPVTATHAHTLNHALTHTLTQEHTTTQEHMQSRTTTCEHNHTWPHTTTICSTHMNTCNPTQPHMNPSMNTHNHIVAHERAPRVTQSQPHTGRQHTHASVPIT